MRRSVRPIRSKAGLFTTGLSGGASSLIIIELATALPGARFAIKLVLVEVGSDSSTLKISSNSNVESCLTFMVIVLVSVSSAANATIPLGIFPSTKSEAEALPVLEAESLPITVHLTLPAARVSPLREILNV